MLYEKLRRRGVALPCCRIEQETEERCCHSLGGEAESVKSVGQTVMIHEGTQHRDGVACSVQYDW